jgi:dUTP pyrophosphatase
MKIEVRILNKRITEWGFPSYGTGQSAGLDLFACLERELKIGPQTAPVLIPTGLALHIADPNWCAMVLPRSGLGHTQGLVLGNAVGIIDADYTGQCFVSAWNRNNPNSADKDDRTITIVPGTRIAQLVLVRVTKPDWTVVETFSQPSARGASGFGSTGML